MTTNTDALPTEAKRGTDAQVLFERELTCEAINGAMAFGYQNTNVPPSDDHWLAPFWKIGCKQAELEAALGAGRAMQLAEVCEDADGTRHIESVVEDLDDVPAGTKLYAAPLPREAATAPSTDAQVLDGSTKKLIEAVSELCDEMFSHANNKDNSAGFRTTTNTVALRLNKIVESHAAHIATAPQATATVPLNDAARDVLAERQRQVTAECWTPAHDDEHDSGEMADAAAAYALHASGWTETMPREVWPADWSQKWWKPTTSRRDLVKAGALILAEIERIDRAAITASADKETDRA
ncbi:hypothetical protein [Paraburkholderia sp. EG304]|uniref:hypothetical protein n=1 Tax=Paraburkholderia sp. EG304 TaxID=3237015 RepID=UPI003979E644